MVRAVVASAQVSGVLALAVAPVHAHDLVALAVNAPLDVHDAAQNWSETLVAIDINGQRISEATLVQQRNEQLCVAVSDLTAWRIVPPPLEPLLINGMSCQPLERLRLRSARLDPATLSVQIEAAPEAFLASMFDTLQPQTPDPTPSDPGGFFNYDLFAQRDSSGVSRYGLFELGVFSDYGNFVNTALTRSTPGDHGTVRLESTLTADLPQHMTSLRLGDSISQAGSWGHAVRFGGVQYGRNFATQPAFITAPLQAASGVATLPSSVDVYINNALSAQRQVPPGPFAIRDLPVVTGSGQITLVVRDLLGREQVLTQAFTSSLSLLRAGLTDYSVEGGAVRRNYSVHGADYGPAMAASTVRHGVNDTLTLEAHGEYSSAISNGGVAAAVLVEPLGTVTAQWAQSTSSERPGGTGQLRGLGLDHAADALSVSLQWQQQTRAFARLGDADQIAPTSSNLNFAASRSFGRWGTLGIACVQRRYFGASQTRIASLNASTSLGPWGYLMASLLRPLDASGASGRTQLNAIWSIPLGQGTHASLARQPAFDGRDEWVTSLQRNPPPDTGWSWLAEASDLGNGRAQVTYAAGIGIVQADAERYSGRVSTRAGVQGGIGTVGGTVFMSRPIHDSFALVRLPDLPNVRVNANNLAAGRTNDRGELLLPALRPYERNTVSVEPLDLGLATEIDRLSVDVVPFSRSGLVVELPIRRSWAVTLRLVLEDASPVPTDAQVRIDSAVREFPVGSDGEVYLSGLRGEHQIEARWGQRRCVAKIRLEPGADPLPDLGAVRCNNTLPTRAP